MSLWQKKGFRIMIRILVDSSADFEMHEIKELKMDFIPISVTLGEENYKDGVDLNKDKLYEMLAGTELFPKTAQPSPADFVEIFEEVKNSGDELIYLSLSSGLSGTYQSAMLAKSMVEYDGIYLVDSLTATHVIRILAEYAVRLREEGLACKDIVAKLESVKSRCKVIAGLDTLEFLCRGGRVSRAAAAIGELANLKPIISVSEEGKIKVIGKCVGRLKATSFLIKQLEDMGVDTAFPLYTIYTYGTENVEKLEEKLAKANVNVAGRQQIGATVGAHVGPGAFGMVFVEKA